ncbi:hypothetical protein CC86DRAFT_391630 [Ophiobolus disseminans]|uniref:Uncharacterized protein n=1 Tax=Ophiobolus disseminans TaxID=1469910 RepID=A0A6A7ABX1_9PLEO|nr:hypothetical protein CC86DRAFT_391630 [Ophiobolus disseminans]
MLHFAPGCLLALLFASHGVAEPIAKPEAVPQQFTNNAPFSGAVYIVDPNGGQVSAQGTNFCPSSASVSCSNVGLPSWCCPANYACASPANSNGLIGCCPSGNTCGGIVNVAQVTTVTVYPQQQTAIVYANPHPQTTVVVNNQPNQAAGGFCATITMSGPGLPRAEQGNCGTILLVAGAPSLKVIGIAGSLVAVTLHLALGRMFYR